MNTREIRSSLANIAQKKSVSVCESNLRLGVYVGDVTLPWECLRARPSATVPEPSFVGFMQSPLALLSTLGR